MNEQHQALMARVAFMLLASRWTSARRYVAVCIIVDAIRRWLMRVPSGERPGVRDAVLLAADAALFLAPSAVLALVLESAHALAMLALGFGLVTSQYVVGDARSMTLVGTVLFAQSYCAARAFTLAHAPSVEAHRSRWACVALALVSVSGAAFSAHGWRHVTLGNAVAYTVLCVAYLYAERGNQSR